MLDITTAFQQGTTSSHTHTLFPVCCLLQGDHSPGTVKIPHQKYLKIILVPIAVVLLYYIVLTTTGKPTFSPWSIIYLIIFLITNYSIWSRHYVCRPVWSFCSCLSCFYVFLCFTDFVWLCFFQWRFIDLFSCIAASLFNKLTYSYLLST